MSIRRWRAVLAVAGVVGGLLLIWNHRTRDETTSSKGEEARSAQGQPDGVQDAPAASLPPLKQAPAASANQQGGRGAIPDPFLMPPAKNLEEIRFQHAATLVKARHDVWAFRQRLKTEDVPPETRDLFRQWAMDLYRDSLIYGMGELPVNDPVAGELAAALRTDTTPQPERIQKSGVPPDSISRTSNLLAKIAALQGNPSRPETLWMMLEFEHLFKKAKQRSDTHFMSVMKDLLKDSQAPLEDKIEFTERFIEIRDLAMAEYPREYFEELMQETTLNPDQRVKVQDLLQKISEMRAP